MKKYFKYIRFAALLSAFIVPACAMAVTQKEMEQARTIAAKAYIRYANDGSGYLDELNPKTIEELEAQLKPKEKENIKAFKAIPVPSDYNDWDKTKLVEYWAVTAFRNKSLLEKGRGGRIRARSQINKMTIAPPQKEEAVTKQAAVSSKAKDTEAGGVKETPAVSADSTLNEIKAEEKQIETRIQEETDDLNFKKESNNTWVYIMILGIIVACVIALVVYAGNVFKKNEYAGVALRKYDEADAEKIEHLESAVADKDVEIAMLRKKLEGLGKKNAELQSKIEELNSEMAVLKNGISSPRGSLSESKKIDTVAEHKAPLRSIFLGRANTRGIFVRADRTLNVGHSVFVLDTTDGYSGSFRVADSPAAWSLALSNPREYLENACTGYNLNDTGAASEIKTESAGTAVFEGGCWRVIRKAKIRYEK